MNGKQMVRLPKKLIATKYSGYFWHIERQALYSIKSGELKSIKKTSPNKFNNLHVGAYQVSVRGQRRYLFLDYLQSLKEHDSKVPYYEY
jgi:hypothetical protein